MKRTHNHAEKQFNANPSAPRPLQDQWYIWAKRPAPRWSWARGADTAILFLDRAIPAACITVFALLALAACAGRWVLDVKDGSVYTCVDTLSGVRCDKSGSEQNPVEDTRVLE